MFKIVKASAGSGKTHALTARYLQLLRSSLQEQPRASCGKAKSGFGWPEILAVTFTNKAASEMKERVVRSLKERAIGLDKVNPAADWPADLAGDWLQVIIRHMGSLNIRTIDSLLYLLVRLSALELGLPPDFEPLFDEDQLVDPLFDAVAARAAAGSQPELDILERACQTVLYVGDAKGFRPTRQFRQRVRDVLRFMLEHDQSLLDDTPGLEARAAECYDTLRAAAVDMLTRAHDDGIALNKNFVSFLDKCQRCATFSKPPESRLIEKGHVTEVVLAKDKDKAGQAAQNAYLALAGAYQTCAGRGRLLAKAAELAPFVELCHLLLDELRTWQRRTGAVPHSLWAGYAKHVLADGCNVPDAFCRMGSRMMHLLVDEFQDTGRDQWDAMEPLAGEALSKGGSLFCVGDVKQAIYGWRGGDATLFEAIAADPGLLALTDEQHTETLPTNWRSCRQVVEFNNAFFGRLADADAALGVARAMLPKAPEKHVLAMADAMAAAFSDAVQLCHEDPEKPRPDGYIRLKAVYGEKKGDMRETAADELQRMLLEDVLTRRPLGDVAILVRKNEDAEFVSQKCIDWGLPVISENSLLLAEHPIVQQITALLAFLDYPLNDIALWEFITGAEIFQQASGIAGRDIDNWLVSRQPGPLYLAFRDKWPNAWQRWIAPLYTQAGLMTPYDMVREILARYDVLRHHQPHELFVRRFLETVHAAEEVGFQSLSTFLEHWKETGVEQKVPLPESVEAIRVMTIHKAKGLEFPVVVIPSHNFSGMRTGDLAAVGLPGADAANLPPAPAHPSSPAVLAQRTPSLGDVFYEAAVPDLCEALNLLYVAWTRPVEELHCLITGADSYKNSPMQNALQHLLADYGLVENGDTFETGSRPPASQAPFLGPGGAPVQPSEPVVAAEELAVDKEADRPMAWLPRLKIFRSALEDAGFDQRRRGTLAHRALENVHLGIDAGDLDRIVNRAVATAMAGETGLPDAEALAAELRQMVGWAASQPRLASLLAAGRAEQGILSEDGQVKRVDRMVETETETVVLEYKTGAAAPEHHDQLRRYLQLLAAMPGRQAKPLRGLLVYLDEQRLEEVAPG